MSEEVAKAVVKKYYVQLLKKLPLKDKIFFGLLYQNKLIPSGSGGVIQELQTNKDKVRYYLDEVVLRGPEEYLPKLPKAMKVCEYLAAENLAAKMQKEMKSGTFITVLPCYIASFIVKYKDDRLIRLHYNR